MQSKKHRLFLLLHLIEKYSYLVFGLEVLLYFELNKKFSFFITVVPIVVCLIARIKLYKIDKLSSDCISVIDFVNYIF